MLRSMILFLCLAAAWTSAAQTTTFYWGAQAYPNYSARRLIVFGTNIPQSKIDELEELETGKFSYSAGLLAGWQGEKMGFRVGLQFMETGYRTVREPFPADAPNPEGASERRLIYRNYNLEVPVDIDFIHELNSSNHFFFSLGGAASLNLGNQVREVLYFGDTSERQSGELPEESFRPLNFAFHSGMGWEKLLNDQTSIFLQPFFQFWLSSLLREAEIDRSIYSVGVRMGIRFYRPES